MIEVGDKVTVVFDKENPPDDRGWFTKANGLTGVVTEIFCPDKDHAVVRFDTNTQELVTDCGRIKYCEKPIEARIRACLAKRPPKPKIKRGDKVRIIGPDAQGRVHNHGDFTVTQEFDNFCGRRGEYLSAELHPMYPVSSLEKIP